MQTMNDSGVELRRLTMAFVSIDQRKFGCTSARGRFAEEFARLFCNGKDLQEQVLKYLTNLDQKWERLHTCMASTRRRLCIFITLHPNESDQ